MKRISKNSILTLLSICLLLLTSCGTVKKHTSDNSPAKETPIITEASNIPVTSKISVVNNSTTYTLTGISGSVENDALITVYSTEGTVINACNATSRGEFQVSIATTADAVVLSATAFNKQESAKATLGLALEE